MDGLTFGTSGLRGLVIDFTADACAAWCGAFAAHLGDLGAPPRAVLIGRDLRPSSLEIAERCAAAFSACGISVIDCGALPTPALALAGLAQGLPAVMVTGSHIPADRNGLKFYRADGEIGKQDEAGVRLALGRRPQAAEAAARAADATPARRYVERYAGLGRAAPLDGLAVGVFQHSSVSRDVLPKILEALGAKTLPFGRSDVFVPLDTEAVDPAVADRLKVFAAENRLSAIVSTDGDGDRPLVTDETGAVLRGDVLGLLTAKVLGADLVATPVTSSSAVEDCGAFARVVRTRVGSPFVIEAMAAADAKIVVGFEANGGVLLGSNVALGDAVLTRLPTRDALLPIVAVLTIARREGRSVSELVRALPPKRTASGRIKHVPAERSGPWLAAIAAPKSAAELVAPQAAPVAIDVIDGVRFSLEGGRRLHFRASGNAPELRVYAEAETEQEAEALLEFGLRRARAALG